MFTRAFNVIGLFFQIIGWKARLHVLAVRRSVFAMLGFLVAAIVALGGLMILLGAGFVALEAIVGVSIAMVAVGVFLLFIAITIWILASQRGKGTGEAMTENETQQRAAKDEEELRSMLGMTREEDKPSSNRPGPRTHSSLQPDSADGLDNPKVVLAAGVALLGLLGPGRLFRSMRFAAALASITALAYRAVNERERSGTPGLTGSPGSPGSTGSPSINHTPAHRRSNSVSERSH